jgi:inorganic pyrophosphatase
MRLDAVGPGAKAPEEINVIVEIPVHGLPVKYELDKETGAMFVDRFLNTAMVYPCNYGYVPMTLSEDGDPVDVLVITPFPLITGAVITCRVIGMLQMTDEKGIDTKLLAVPLNKLTSLYADIKSYQDVQKNTLDQIAHFFEHYKDLEPNKWVKVEGWKGVEEAHAEIRAGIKRFNGE